MGQTRNAVCPIPLREYLLEHSARRPLSTWGPFTRAICA